MTVRLNEFILVAGRTALVETRSSALTSIVAEETIDGLPLNGRNFLDLAVLQPGVAVFKALPPAARGQQLNINGAGGRSNSYLLDGANMKGVAGKGVSNASDTTLGLEMIREYRVLTNAFAADYGRAMGGVLSAVTKSGTNELRGTAFEFFRHRTLNARNFFDVDKPPFERNQFGFTIGGPMRRDRTFFFSGAEWLFERTRGTRVTTVPTAAARSGALGSVNPIVRPYLDMLPLPNGPELGEGLARFTFPFKRTAHDALVQLRIDHNFSPATSFFTRYTLDAATQWQPQTLPQFVSDRNSRNQWLTVETRRVSTASLLNTLRFSYSRLRDRDDLVAGVGDDLAFIPGQPTVGNFSIGGLLFGPDQAGPTVGDIDYFTVSDDVTLAKGRHLIKTGALIERAHTYRITTGRLRGRYNFPTLQRFLAGTPSLFSGILPGAEIERARRNTVFGFYVQDDITAHSQLTLNLGLRYEFYTVPTDVEGRDSALRNIATDREYTIGPPFRNPSLKNFAPRVGFAWDLAGYGKTAIRAGAGLYYDTDGPFNTPLNVASFSPPFSVPVSIPNPTFPQPSFDAAASRAARGVDYQIGQPRLFATNVNIQWEVVPRHVVMVGYAGSRGYDLVYAVEGNPVIPETLADGTQFFPPAASRRNPYWDSIDFRTSGARSWYDALYVSAASRSSSGHRWQISYSFGRTIDETQGQVPIDAANNSVFPQDPINPQNDRGPADYDVRHILTGHFSWELPFGRELTGVAGALVRGWRVSGLGTVRSGVPFSPSIASNWSGSGNVSVGAEDRPNVRPGVRLDDIVVGDVNRYFDPDAFVLQRRGVLGSAGRNMLTGPGFANFDLSLVKSRRIPMLGPHGAVEVRIEVFNVFNRANFAIPNRVVFSGAREGEAPLVTAGQITSTVSDARQGQLGLKFKF